MVHLDKLFTWKKFKPSMCENCYSDCCKLPVEIDKEDLLRMGLVTIDEIHSSLKKVARRLKKEKWIQGFRASSGLFILAQSPSGACVFLSNQNRCTIYEKRPTVCRRFPEVGPKPGYCPARQKEVLCK